MPVMGGSEVAHNIRTQRPFIDDPIIQSIPVVGMAPGSVCSRRQWWMERGMNDMISKPIRIRHLHRLLLDWSKRKVAPCPRSGMTGNMHGPGARGVMTRPVWGPMPLRRYMGPRSLL